MSESEKKKYTCTECGKEKVTEKVREYSVEHFDRIICYECQQDLRDNAEDEGQSQVDVEEAQQRIRFHPATVGMVVKEANRYILEKVNADEITKQTWAQSLAEVTKEGLKRLEDEGVIERGR